MRLDKADIHGLPLFEGVGTSRVDDLLQASCPRRFPARLELVREGTRPDFLHVVLEGQVQLYSVYGGRETSIAVLDRGGSFVLSSVILNEPYPNSGRTLLPSRILQIPSDAVRACFSGDGAFARALALVLAGSHEGVVRELKNQKLRPIERLAAWLLAVDLEEGEWGRFDLPFEKRVLASRLGMAPAVLSRSIAALGSLGVRVRRRSVEIRDRGALVRLAYRQAGAPAPTPRPEGFPKDAS